MANYVCMHVCGWIITTVTHFRELEVTSLPFAQTLRYDLKKKKKKNKIKKKKEKIK